MMEALGTEEVGFGRREGGDGRSRKFFVVMTSSFRSAGNGRLSETQTRVHGAHTKH